MNEVPYGPLELLVIQASPFCNINCNYCYLPTRNKKIRLSYDTIEEIFKGIFNSDIVQQDFTVCWHAGEPLVVPISFYKEAIKICSELNTSKYKTRHSVQTNGTLITDEWCELFKNYSINVSVSIDGPEFIHDSSRVDRKGKGTFSRVMKGIEILKRNEIPFNVISVVNSATLSYPKEYYSFFKELNPSSLGMSIEEIENANVKSSLLDSKNDEMFSNFIKKIFQYYYQDNPSFHIREFVQLESFILSKDKFMNGHGQQTTPFRIISVDAEGNFSTFSPELLNHNSILYNNFRIGNFKTTSIKNSFHSQVFQQMYADILKGIIKCKEECSYFSVCGGGSPSNKYSENGNLTSTETNFCRYKFQNLFDIYLAEVESAATSLQRDEFIKAAES